MEHRSAPCYLALGSFPGLDELTLSPISGGAGAQAGPAAGGPGAGACPGSVRQWLSYLQPAMWWGDPLLAPIPPVSPTPCSWDGSWTLCQRRAGFHSQLQHGPWPRPAALMCLSFPSHGHHGLCRELLHTPAATYPKHCAGWAHAAATGTGAHPARPRMETANLCLGCLGHFCSASLAREGISDLGRTRRGKESPSLERESVWTPGQPSQLHPQQLPAQIRLRSAHPVQDQLCSTQHPPFLGSTQATGLCHTAGTKEHPAWR